MKETLKRSRKFFIRSYLSDDQISHLVLNHDVENYCYIRHDKDTRPSDDNPDVNVLKEPHIHLVLITRSAHTVSAVQRWLDYTDDNCKKINSDVQICADVALSYRYLTHKDHPEKYQYSDDDIISSNKPYFESLAANGDDIDSTDNTLSIFDDFLLFLNSGKTDIRYLVKKYGKDFLYHYSSYRLLGKDILTGFTDIWKES